MKIRKPSKASFNGLKFENIGDLTNKTGKPYVWIGHYGSYIGYLELKEAKKLAKFLNSYIKWNTKG